MRLWSRLVECQKGAVMITAIFMVLFLVAMLYVVVGIGRTIVMREGMQDAADAAAYSSAILHARGMNLIAFVNLLMAALVSILVALRMAQTFFAMATAALVVIGAFTYGSTAPLIAKTTKLTVDMGDYFKRAKNSVEPILEGLHTTQEAVSVVVPWVAMTEGMVEATAYHEPADGAFAVPGAISLPVEADEFSVLCGHATKNVAALALLPVEGLLSLPDSVLDAINDAASGIGESTSKFLCGDGSGAPPTHSQKLEKRLPRPPGEAACLEEPTSSACKKIELELGQAEPATTNGHCRSKCTYDGPYETMARRARVDCESRQGYFPRNYAYQERTVHATLRYDGFEWHEEQVTSRRDTLKQAIPPPCGARGTVNDLEWELDSGPRDQREPNPVCTGYDPPLPVHPPPETLSRVTITEVVRVFSCEIVTTKTHELADKGDAMGGASAEARSPHRVQTGTALGDEGFQIRALAFGPPVGPGKLAQDGVLLSHRGAAWDDTTVSSDLTQLAGQLGRFSVAQAEYYFDHQGEVDPKDYLWDMGWTARLKHVRLPSEEEEQEEEARRNKNSRAERARLSTFVGVPAPSTLGAACQGAGASDCASLGESLSLFDSIVRH